MTQLSDEAILYIKKYKDLLIDNNLAKFFDIIINDEVTPCADELRNYLFETIPNVLDYFSYFPPKLFWGVLEIYGKPFSAISIPNGIETIERSTFRHCDMLKDVVFPSSLKSIGNRAFAQCKNLSNVKLPDSLVSIEDFAFVNCESFTEFVIPPNVRQLGHAVLSGCKSIKQISLSKQLAETIIQDERQSMPEDIRKYAPDDIILQNRFALWDENLDGSLKINIY